jgi:hypothetical protein
LTNDFHAKFGSNVVVIVDYILNYVCADAEQVAETRTESSPAQPPAEPLFPGPSPAPPSPDVAVTLDESAAKLSPADNEDVQRFVSAVKTSDESLGDGVELFQAPLIAAFALQQDGLTGITRSLLAFPVNKAHEELLKQERQILSVAGQVIGTQRTGILPRTVQQQQQQNFGRVSNIDIQRSVQPQFRQQDPPQFLNEVEPLTHLQRLERRQQELQQQLINLQRERSAFLLQRSTRANTDESLQTAASSSPFSIPIYLQPPFF